jgi:hypothetical protein
MIIKSQKMHNFVSALKFHNFTGLMQCGDASFAFCSILLESNVALPYTIITAYFENSSNHTIVFAEKTTFDPLNNIFIPNFKFAFDEVNISTEFVPISNQNKMHDHILEFFKNYYSLDKIIKINQFVVLKK